jgi:hypothetical protein
MLASSFTDHKTRREKERRKGNSISRSEESVLAQERQEVKMRGVQFQKRISIISFRPRNPIEVKRIYDSGIQNSEGNAATAVRRW